MRILGGIALVLVIIAGIGFYRGWFRVASNNADASSKITLTVDKDKIRDDRESATEKAEDLGHDAKEMVADDDAEDKKDSAVSPEMESKTAKLNADEPGNRAIDNLSAPVGNSHVGIVVSVGDALKMTDEEGNEHRHMVAANVQITCDGKVCTAADLKPGMKIRVTTESADPHMVTRIEALEHRDAFDLTG